VVVVDVLLDVLLVVVHPATAQQTKPMNKYFIFMFPYHHLLFSGASLFS